MNVVWIVLIRIAFECIIITKIDEGQQKEKRIDEG